ncbi:WD repeat-containing protein 83 [Entomophthora muscae]|uniref:WD repeat-containing protein 83 n=1 Tax=Entomophthora muscae TaxID=34485 RepID=A0ACC2SCU2_9FUNG|nr:WD repeat-containing protein 83 [Entomophthora muscae]
MVILTTQKGHTLSSHQGAVNVIKYSSNGEYCLSGGMDRTIKIWNPNLPSSRDRLIQTFSGHGWEVQDIDLSCDNTKFVSGGGDKAVFLWDVATCLVSRKLTGHTQKINCVHFNADSSVIASGSYDTTVRLWDCRSQSRLPIQILEEGKDSIISLRILGHEILTGSVDNKVRHYDLRMGKLATDDLPASVTNVAFTKDANCFLVSSLDSTIRLLDKADGTLLNQ